MDVHVGTGDGFSGPGVAVEVAGRGRGSGVTDSATRGPPPGSVGATPPGAGDSSEFPTKTAGPGVSAGARSSPITHAIALAPTKELVTIAAAHTCHTRTAFLHRLPAQTARQCVRGLGGDASDASPGGPPSSATVPSWTPTLHHASTRDACDGRRVRGGRRRRPRRRSPTARLGSPRNRIRRDHGQYLRVFHVGCFILNDVRNPSVPCGDQRLEDEEGNGGVRLDAESSIQRVVSRADQPRGLGAHAAGASRVS